jgi:hypothetical protein
MNDGGDKQCQTKKTADAADATQQSVDATVATMVKQSRKTMCLNDDQYCSVCECDPCDCGWGHYYPDKER